MKRKSKPDVNALTAPVGTASADISLWSEKSKRSYSCFEGCKYTDIEFDCLKCQAVTVFTALDQKHVYEVEKAHISQQRLLCPACHAQSQGIAADITACEVQWAQSKNLLREDANFLARWLALLHERETYRRGIVDSATKAMLKKLLNAFTDQ